MGQPEHGARRRARAGDLAFPDIQPVTALLFSSDPGVASGSNPAVVQVPAETVAGGGASTGAFAVSTSPVTSTTSVTITARWFGITRTAAITVRAGAPAPADVVRITRATWDRGRYSDERGWVTNPQQIQVRSNFGGSATANLSR